MHHQDDINYDYETDMHYCEECYNKLLKEREECEDEEYFEEEDDWVEAL